MEEDVGSAVAVRSRKRRRRAGGLAWQRASTAGGLRVVWRREAGDGEGGSERIGEEEAREEHRLGRRRREIFSVGV